ncbi:MAG: hypothetical protein KHX55_02580 [Proteobacteria bacterium]|nr:hypothetical protein [Pseudomonadota bacterium]
MKKYAKIINEETKACDVGVGTDTKFYVSIGMVEMDVEQGNDGNWYVAGFAPHEPEPTVEEQNESIRQQRFLHMTTEADPLKYDYEEALARGADNVEELKAAWLAKKDEIREQLPYIAEETQASEEDISEA